MIRFKVNGKEKTFDGDPDMPLLWYLRDVAELTGTLVPCTRMARRFAPASLP
jgi:isoquinoline 1-oxidoreductase alpha subunit